MPSLKTLRNRIASVKSTQKITKAMKMVAAAKLRRAQSQAEAARPYAQHMAAMLDGLAASAAGNSEAPRLLAGTGTDRTHLIVAITAERGLAGAFNSSIGRAVRDRVRALQAEGKQVKLLPVGRKGRDYLRREFRGQIIGDINFAGQKTISFADAEGVANRIIEEFRAGGFDVCTLVFNKFISVVTQTVTELRLIPAYQGSGANDNQRGGEGSEDYEIEPDDGTLLDRLLPRNLAIQIYSAQLDSAAGFFAAQMTAMDNATRNAGDMINRLTLNYNRTRQANITRELIEIISGAEAL
jgi:F-type H+-transporting ATPase subunit gamma